MWIHSSVQCEKFFPSLVAEIITDQVTPEQHRISELEEEVGALRKRGQERERELDALREELAKVRKEIEEWKRGSRAREAPHVARGGSASAVGKAARAQARSCRSAGQGARSHRYRARRPCRVGQHRKTIAWLAGDMPVPVDGGARLDRDTMWARVDPKLRARAFAELRRRQAHGEAHGLTPTERLARAEELREVFAPAAGAASISDEPPELWLRILAELGATP